MCIMYFRLSDITQELNWLTYFKILYIYIYTHLGGLGGGSGSSGTQNFNYTFHGDPKATFAQFFGSSNPFENFFNMPGMGGNTQAVLF